MPGQVTRRRSNRWRGLALLASALIVLSACGSSTPTPAPGEATAPVSNAEPTAGQSPGNLPSSPAPAGPPLSETLIAAALEAGTITYEQSLLYRALALFGSPGLPEEFRSPISDMGAATALLKEIDQKESELSAGLLEQLAPYRVRPADPVSIFNNPPGQGSLGIVYAVATPAPTTPPPTWTSQLVAGTGARVWVKDGPDAGAKLTSFADVVAKVWAQLPGVFRYPEPDKPGDPNLSINPDGAIDIYFVDIGAIDPRRADCAANPGGQNCVFRETFGYCTAAAEFRGTSSSGFLVLNAGQPGFEFVDTLAHELTHAGQNAYDWKESDWLAESTATWAAYRVLQKLNLLPTYEYQYLPQFFWELDRPLPQLDQHSAQHEYRSWFYFLFASMEAGDAIVTSVWEKAAAEGVQSEKAVDQAFPFDDHFADFSVRNWNQDPVTPQYKDVAPAPFPAGLRPKISSGAKVFTDAGESLLDQPVLPLASIYYTYEFKDAVRMVTLKNTLTGLPHAHVWAIKKIGDTWSAPEDWTGDAKKEFCRDVPEEDLTELVLIVSNSGSDVAQPATARLRPAEDPTLTAHRACLYDLFGTISIQRTEDFVREGANLSTLTENLQATVQVAMRTDPEDPDGFVDAGSTFRVERVATSEVSNSGDCTPTRYVYKSTGSYYFADQPAPPAPGGGGAPTAAPTEDPGGGSSIFGMRFREQDLVAIMMVAYYPYTVTEESCTLLTTNPFATPEIVDLWACGDKLFGTKGLGVEGSVVESPKGPDKVVIDCTYEGPDPYGNFAGIQRIVAKGTLTIARTAPAP